MGAQFAAFAAHNLKYEKNPFVNKYFVFTVLYLTIIYAPTGTYLLWGYTAWETMFMVDIDLHPIFPALFQSSLVCVGVLGFFIAYKLIHNGYSYHAHTLWILSYMAFFAIIGIGYRRFMFPGSLDDWQSGQWKLFPIRDYFNFEVCWVLPTLLIMIPIVIPPIYYPMLVWPREECKKESLERRDPQLEKWFLVSHVGKLYLYGLGFGTAAILFYLNIIANDSMREYQKQDTILGYHAPLGGFYVSEFVFILISWWVYFVYPEHHNISWDTRRRR